MTAGDLALLRLNPRQAAYCCMQEGVGDL